MSGETKNSCEFYSWPSSGLNILLVFIPIAWAAHFSNAAQAHEIEEDPEHRSPTWPYPLTFVMCFLAIIPLEKLFDYGNRSALLRSEPTNNL
jgi:Ca2+:H+ antiporter